MKNFKSLSQDKAVFICIFFLLITAIPTLIIGGRYYQSFNIEMTNYVTSQRETVADLSAVALELKIEQLASTTSNIAADNSIKTSFGNGDWATAEERLTDLLEDPANYNYYIDRTKFANTEGIVEAGYPGVSAKAIGTIDPAFTEWQTPILQEGRPWFISNVYLGKTSGSDYVELVVPVKDTKLDVVGVVISQIYTNNFSDFGKDVDVGSDGFAYFVDRNANIVTHPKYSSNGPLISYASVPVVHAALAGQHGVGIFYNPIERVERVSAYTQVPEVGWGVIAQEPEQEAFANRDSTLTQILLIIVFISFIDVLGSCLLLWLLVHKKHKNKKSWGHK